jgi:hypothetical protein
MLLVVILCCVVSVLAGVTAFTVNKDNTVTDIDVVAVKRETEEDAPPPFPIHCRGNWSKYSPCVDGETSREFEVIQEANETGVPCPSPLTKTYPCEAQKKQHCLGAWRDFGECQYTGVEKVYGTRSQSYKVIKPKRGEDMRECRYDGLTGDIVEDGDIKTTTCEKPCSDDEKVGNVGNISAWKDEVIIARCQKCTGQSEANCKEWLYPTCQIEVGEHDDGNFIDGEEDTDANVSGWKKDGWGNTDGDAIMKDQISSYRTKGPSWTCRYKAYERVLNHPDGSGESILLTPDTASDRWSQWRRVPDEWDDRINALQITGGGRRDLSLDAAWRNIDSDSDDD